MRSLLAPLLRERVTATLDDAPELASRERPKLPRKSGRGRAFLRASEEWRRSLQFISLCNWGGRTRAASREWGQMHCEAEEPRFVLATYTKLAGWHRAPMHCGDSNVCPPARSGAQGGTAPDGPGTLPASARTEYLSLLDRRRKNAPNFFSYGMKSYIPLANGTQHIQKLPTATPGGMLTTSQKKINRAGGKEIKSRCFGTSVVTPAPVAGRRRAPPSSR